MPRTLTFIKPLRNIVSESGALKINTTAIPLPPKATKSKVHFVSYNNDIPLLNNLNVLIVSVLVYPKLFGEIRVEISIFKAWER